MDSQQKEQELYNNSSYGEQKNNNFNNISEKDKVSQQKSENEVNYQLNIEDIKIESTTIQEFNTNPQANTSANTKTKNEQIKNKKLKITLIAIGATIAIFLIIFLPILFKVILVDKPKIDNTNQSEDNKPDKPKTDDSNQPEDDTSDKPKTDDSNQPEDEEVRNMIALQYRFHKGKQINLFNPGRIGLNDSQYLVTMERKKKNGLRRITEVHVENGNYLSDIDQLVKINISFSVPIETLDFLFENCEDLVSVDFSHLGTTISSMVYTFTNCSSLESVNLNSLNTSNTSSTDFLFAQCPNLTNVIGIDVLNTTSIKSTNGMFFECTSIVSLNLSSFNLDTLNNLGGMISRTQSLRGIDLSGSGSGVNLFDSPNDVPGDMQIIVGNQTNTSLLTQYTSFLLTVSVELSCTTGEGEKCKTCNDTVGSKINCASCNPGYYLPADNKLSRSKCKKCSQGCSDCYLDEDEEVVCSECSEGYFLSNDACIKIDIDNCTAAINNSETGEVECTKCAEGYLLHENKCYETCKTGEEEKCASCNPDIALIKNCYLCNTGYYRDDSIDSTKCQKCDSEIKNCAKCSFISNNLKCGECKNGYELVNNQCYKVCDVGEFESCATCKYDGEDKGDCDTCNDGFYLPSDEGDDVNKTHCYSCPENCKHCEGTLDSPVCMQCIDNYNLTETKECELLCELGTGSKCKSCQTDIKNYCSSCNPDYFLPENPPKLGACYSCGINHCKLCSGSYSDMKCEECEEGYSYFAGYCLPICILGTKDKCLTCSDNMNTMTICFGCNDGYYLPTDEGVDKSKCYKCKNDYCLSCSGSLTETVCSKCDNDHELVEGLCKEKCVLGENEKCLSCDYIENKGNCLSCNDGYYLHPANKQKCEPCDPHTLTCIYNNDLELVEPLTCEEGYVISGRKCMKPCQIGENNQCASCSEVDGKIDECGSCNNGFFLPDEGDNVNRSICYSCGVVNCRKCSGTIDNHTCTECYNNYLPYENVCIKNCETGSGKKCATCSTVAGKNNECGTCNEEYYLANDTMEGYDNPLYNKTECRKCSNHCKKCKGSFMRIECTECDEDSQLHTLTHKCFDKCSVLETEGCSVCNESIAFSTYANCTKCIDGYYLPSDRDSTDEEYNKCYKCSLEGCKSCSGPKDQEICEACEDGLFSKSDENGTINSCYPCDIGVDDKCRTCSADFKCGSCNPGYTLEDGECYPNSYSFIAIYEISDSYVNRGIRLFKCTSVSSLVINGTSRSISCGYDYQGYYSTLYYFSAPGTYKLFIRLSGSPGLSHFFEHVPQLKSVKFGYAFDGTTQSLMNGAFAYSINLEEVDLTPLRLIYNQCFQLFTGDSKLKKVKFSKRYKFTSAYYFYDMFQGCTSLTSVDLSMFTLNNVGPMYDMFSGCSQLTYIDLSSFGYYSGGIYGYDSMFNGLPATGTIKISSSFPSILARYIPSGWTIIY